MKESDIQSAIMCALGQHPRIAWCYVTSTGTFKGLKGGRPIKIGIPGLPDILFQTVNGLMGGIEVKKPNEKPTPIQFEFLEMISRNGGISGWATNVKEAIEIIEE